MNANLFKMELKFNLVSFIIWFFSINVLITGGMAFYPVISKGNLMDSILVLFDNPLMKTMMAAFGVDVAGLASLEGYYVTYISIYTILTGCIFAVVLGTTIVAREEYNKTAEFLLTRPVKRESIFLTKYMVLFVLVSTLGIGMFFSGIAGLELFKQDYSVKVYVSPVNKKILSLKFKEKPEEFRRFFQLTEKDYIQFTVANLISNIQAGSIKGKPPDIDLKNADVLLNELLVSPEDITSKIISSPQTYSKMLNLTPLQESLFMGQLGIFEQRIKDISAGLQKNPVKYVEIFENDPVKILSPLKNSEMMFNQFAVLFGVDASLKKEILIYYNLQNILILSLYTYLLILLMGALGLFLSMITKRAVMMSGIGIGLTFAFYFIYTLTKMSKSIEFIGYLSPFKFVDSDILNPSYHLSVERVLYFVVLIGLFSVLSFMIYRKKDILL